MPKAKIVVKEIQQRMEFSAVMEISVVSLKEGGITVDYPIAALD